MHHYQKIILSTLVAFSTTTNTTPPHYIKNREERVVEWLSKDFPQKINMPSLKKKLEKNKRDQSKNFWLKKPFILQKIAAHKNAINSITTLDEQTIITASTDGTIKLWNPQTLYCKKTISPKKGPIISISCNKDGTLLAFSTNSRSGGIWNIKKNRLESMLEGKVGQIEPNAFFKNEKQILAPTDKGCVKIWDTHTGKIIKTFSCHTDVVRTAKLYEEENIFITASDDESACTWRLQDGQLIKKFSGHSDWVKKAIKVDQQIFTAAADNSFGVWNLKTDQKYLLPVHKNAQTLCIHANKENSKILTTGSNGEIKIWNTPNMQLNTNFKNEENTPILCAIFSPHKKVIYLGDGSGQLKTLQYETKLTATEKLILAAFKKYKAKTNCSYISFPTKSLWEWIWKTPKTSGEKIIQELNNKHDKNSPLIPTSSPITIANLFTLNNKIDTLNKKSSLLTIDK